MKISEILSQNKLSVSCELFPPKKSEQLQNVKNVVAQTAALSPSFISCTYGATGGTSDFTVDVAKEIKANGIPALAHLTCVSSTREKVHSVIERLKSEKIENILALRGDIPKDDGFVLPNDYHYACDLIKEIKEMGNFCIGGACYPEGHPESESLESDMAALKNKYESGAEFLTTQMFFDNDVYYRFRERAVKNGIDIPIVAGIMPVTSASRFAKMMELSNSRVPKELTELLEKYGSTEEMEKAGIEYAVNQINDIIDHGYKAIHIYTMNRPSVAQAIMEGIERK